MKNTAKRSNGEGAVYYVEKLNKWRAEITWRDSSGKTLRKHWQGSKQSDVRTKLNEFKNQLASNSGNANSQSVTFKEFADFWIFVLRHIVRNQTFR